MDFAYDTNGAPYTLTYDGTKYYYITNVQGDVMRLIDTSGNPAATYSYDPFGKVLSASGSMAEINPIRYRGYCYDTETGFYYLQSRYYDPAICRFINADVFTSTGQGFLGYNMFAYCGNNPENETDPTGMFGFWTVFGGAVAGAITSTVSYLASNSISGEEVTAGGVLNAVLVGGVTGAVGAIIGEVEGAAQAICAVAVGVVAGVNAARNTQGDIGEKIGAGFVAGGIAAGAAFLGSSLLGKSLNVPNVSSTIEIANDVAQGMVNYTSGLIVGPTAELLTYGAQQGVNYLGDVFFPASTTSEMPTAESRPRPRNYVCVNLFGV